jgi:hypothetical protein
LWQPLPGSVRTPFRLVQEALRGIRCAVTDQLDRLPAILAQHPQVLGSLCSRPFATKDVGEASVEPQRFHPHSFHALAVIGPQGHSVKCGCSTNA